MPDEHADSWQRAQAILADALELGEGERDTFVRRACEGDAQLLAEVRSLLAASREADAYFEDLAGRVVGAATGERTPEMVGRVVGAFEVREAIGRGGMGEVYRALDRRLGREVALKVLPADLARDPQHVTRFRREARVVASLDHPNVARIHGVEEVDDTLFLVLELVEGPTLKDRLREGPLSLDEAFDVGRQIADALDAAHDVGVVHRDLKPANVKVGPDGKVRVLDFGVAKAPERLRAPGDHLDASPPTPVDVTVPGMVIGTAAYMSPEQARGKPIDTRSDVWAFGALLYETLTGRKAFEGEDLTQVVARILEGQPDWSALPPETPESVRRLLSRCLERNVRRRLQAIGEARIVLEDALARPEPPPAVAASSARRAGAPWAWMALAVLVGLAAGVALGPDRGAEGARSRTFRLAVAEDAGTVELAPSGDRLLFQGSGAPWVVSFDGTAPRSLDGAEGGYAFFWSPDGEQVGFFRDNAIWRVGADGGQPTVVGTPGDRGFYGAAWLEDGTVVASVGGAIVAFPETGGEPRTIWTSSDEQEPPVRAIEAGPDGGVLMIRGREKIALLRDGRMTEVWSAARGTIRALAWAPPSHLLFLREGEDPGIWALSLGSDGLPSGRPFLVSDAVADPSASHDGQLVYFDRRTSRQRRTLVWVDRTGTTLGAVGGPQRRLEQFEVSPSGERVVAVAEDGDRRRIWIHDVESGERYALSPMPDPGQRWPSWSPAEDRILFRYDQGLEQRFGLKSLEPGTEPVDLEQGVYPVFAPDGSVLFSRDGDIFRLDPDRPGEATPFIASPELESRGRVSGSGLVAYQALTATGVEVFVTRFDRPGERWQVSPDGGAAPRWTADGREIVYIKEDTLVAVTVDLLQDGVRIGRPERLFAIEDAGGWGREFDVHPDGTRILMLRALPRLDIEDVDAIVLVQDWVADFARGR